MPRLARSHGFWPLGIGRSSEIYLRALSSIGQAFRSPRMTTATKMANDPALNIGKEKLLRLYERMVAIRLFEERVNDLYTRALMPGLAHLYIGEEAIAVGVCEALRSDDYITSTHRGHGHCLAKGATP